MASALLAGCGGSSTTTVSAPSNSAPSSGAGGATGASGGGNGSPTPGVYVAQVTGTDASIALVTDGHRLSGAYLCIPKEVSQWIRPSPLASGQGPLVARRGVVLGKAKLAGDTASGKVDAGGTHSFSAKLATGYAGLYRTTSGTANQPGFSETGWIVLPTGKVCGSTNSITAGGGFKSTPAPSKPKGLVTNFADPFPF